jgi:hypothetical protein
VAAQALSFRPAPAVLDLLRRLPEEEVGADRRAEHGDDHRRVFLAVVAAGRKAHGRTDSAIACAHGTETTRTTAT